VATLLLEGAKLVQKPRRVLANLPGFFVGTNDELLGVVDHVLEDVHHIPDGRAGVTVRRDIVGDVVALVGALEAELECRPPVAKRDTPQCEEVRQEAHRVVELR